MANNAQNPLGPQPDFHLMRQSRQNLAGVMRKVPNLPQFHDGNAILERLDRIDRNIRIGDHNNAARISNSLVALSTERLTELIKPAHGTEIAGFPATPGEIGTMTTPTLISVLEQLGLQTAGRRAAKEQRLRGFIGLKLNPQLIEALAKGIKQPEWIMMYNSSVASSA